MSNECNENNEDDEAGTPAFDNKYQKTVEALFDRSDDVAEKEQEQAPAETEVTPR